MDTNQAHDNRERMVSLDVMRGLVMISIIGFGHLCTKLFLYSQSEDWRNFWHMMHKQLKHAEWHGLTFFDLVLPLFIFVSGMTLGVANKTLIGTPFKERWPAYRKALLRLLILVVLGLIFNHATRAYWPVAPENIRCTSVLGMIGWSWFAAAMISWHGSNRTIIATIAAIAIVIPILRFTIHVPDHGYAQFTPDGSLNALVDSIFLPGATYGNQPHDPEGIIPLIVSVIVSLCGVLAGKWLIRRETTPALRISGLAAAGSIFILTGFLLDTFMPINKYLWTIPYAILATGWCAVIAAVSHLLFDIIKLKWLALPFVAVGMNGIFVYMGYKLIDWPHIVQGTLGWTLPFFTDRFQPVAMSLYILSMQILLAAWMYKRRIFIKV